jgi:hypothetical protein
MDKVAVPGFDPSILRQSGMCGAADESVLNNVHKRKHPKNPPSKVPDIFSATDLQYEY